MLAYELHVTNVGDRPLRLDELRIGTEDGKRVLATYRDSALRALLRPVGAPAANDSTRLGVGRRVIIFLWLDGGSGRAVPSRLRHRLVFTVLDVDGAPTAGRVESAIDSIVVSVATQVPVLGRPVREGEWYAGNGPSNVSDHRRALIALDGDVFIAQRFAIDWVKIGPNGNTFHDDRTRNENFWDFGQDVLAPADGEVVALVDTIPDNDPKAPLPAATLATIAGNHLTIRVAEHQYVLFAHLKRGSVRVRLHDRVRAGDVVAAVGNSGQSTGPHLHMQVMDRNAVLAAEGLPFVFDRYDFLGYGRDFDEAKHPRLSQRHQLPLDDTVVGFTGR